MGLYHPVTLSGLEVLVKTENGSDCMMSGESQAQSSIGGNYSAHAATGEIIAFFFLSVPLHSVESKMFGEHGMSYSKVSRLLWDNLSRKKSVFFFF